MASNAFWDVSLGKVAKMSVTIYVGWGVSGDRSYLSIRSWYRGIFIDRGLERHPLKTHYLRMIFIGLISEKDKIG